MKDDRGKSFKVLSTKGSQRPKLNLTATTTTTTKANWEGGKEVVWRMLTVHRNSWKIPSTALQILGQLPGCHRWGCCGCPPDWNHEHKGAAGRDCGHQACALKLKDTIKRKRFHLPHPPDQADPLPKKPCRPYHKQTCTRDVWSPERTH